MNLYLKANQITSITLINIVMTILMEILSQIKLSLEKARDSFRLEVMPHFLILCRFALQGQMKH